MPTFNQLVRKGRTVAEVKSTAPALQKGYNAKKKTAEAWCVHCCQNFHTEEAELCYEKDRQSTSDKWLRSNCLHSGYRS